ncbi:MAG: glycosyl hydrolase, partial [Rhodocyclales bacterium]|nr:glycosyl hydrolase [Rhodocyclales bacterium]
APPDGAKLHSIIVDPRDPAHLYLAMSSGGVHESTDGGRRFKPLIDGLEVVEGFDRADATFHDPHCVRLCPSRPDRLYQQNHCGIYRLDRPAQRWQRIGVNMPADIGDIGFPLAVHPRDADTAWVFPMDGTTVWPRTSPGGRPAVYATHNAGATWQRLDVGLPASQAWWTVKRQAMTTDRLDPVGLYFGTTSGELWMSGDEGRHWTCIARHLPEIYAVEAAEPA